MYADKKIIGASRRRGWPRETASTSVVVYWVSGYSRETSRATVHRPLRGGGAHTVMLSVPSELRPHLEHLQRSDEEASYDGASGCRRGVLTE